MSSFKLTKFQGFILPIIVVTILAALLSASIPIAFSKEDLPSSAPVDPSQTGGNEVAAGFVNAIIWVIIAFVGSIIVLLIIKLGRQSLLRAFFAIMMGLSTFSFIMIYFWPFINIILDFIYVFLPVVVNNVLVPFLEFSGGTDFRIVDIFWLTSSVILAIVTILIMGFDIGGRRGKNVFLIVFGAMVGAYLGYTFPLWSTVLVLLGISIFDIYSVFRGPIRGMLEEDQRHLESQGFIPIDRNNETGNENEVKRIAKEPSVSKESFNKPNNPGPNASSDLSNESDEQSEVQYVRLQILDQIVYNSGEVQIGLGDFAFYSFLVGHAVLYLPFAPFLAILGIVFGAALTFKILDSGRVTALPGLPIPIFLGLLGMIGGGLLNNILSMLFS
ncbi:MAG: hypothetical protein ACFFBD_23745 [Candidatus Hodarchaeota archaeon]